MSSDVPEPADEPATFSGSLIESLTYAVTIPERTARSVSALVGGLVHETSARLIPTVFRSSRTYSVFVQQALDMMVHDVGGVPTDTSEEQASDEDDEEAMLARKTVGGMLDIAGAATLHLSPLTVLAVFNDVAYGSSFYLKKLSEELKREGIIDEKSSIDKVSDLISELQATSEHAADAVNAPPINVDGVTKTVAELTDKISKVDPTDLIPESELKRIWEEMELAAAKSNSSLWAVSTTMTMFAMNRLSLTTRGAFSGITLASDLFDEHIVGHYGDALTEISEHGLYEILSKSAVPYLDAVWHNFDGKRETWTEDVVTGRFFSRAWAYIRSWFSS